MKTSVIQAVVYNALSVLSLWASTSVAQGQPRIALKLSPAAHEKQQADPNFIAALIQKAQPKVQTLSFSAPKVAVSPLIKSKSPARLRSRIARAAKRDAASDALNFDVWYSIEVGSGSGSQARSADATAAQNTTGTAEPVLSLPKDTLDLIHQLHKLAEVESVHALHPGPPPQAAIDPSDDPRRPNQGYLNAAPQGINAPYGWGFAGGDGTGVNIVDVEQGWNFNHEDLAAAGVTLISGRNQAYFGHGTSVLGEMFMVDNQLGGIGIIPGAKGRVVSQHRADGSYNTAEAILDAAAHMSFGDIMLLEAQEYNPVTGVYYWPVEVADANYEAIKAATDLGIIVVQAGCNGGNDLDAYVDLAGKSVFNRNSPDFRDSLSIMVGGSNSPIPHTRWYASNYGTRMDVYAWAEAVDTTNTDDETGTQNLYTGFFGGTSGASPIIVGAAAIVQGISVATRGSKMGPQEIRDILSAHGTPSSDPSDLIGVMPDLQAIIDTVFGGGSNQSSDVYIRDHVGDNGGATSGSVSASPDIIVRQQPIPNPQDTLGTGSGTESNPALSDSVQAGHDHSIYIRLSNRGSAATTSATTATVYWSEPATLVTPNLWHEIGTVSVASPIPADPSLLTVLPGLDWPAASVPGTGHYCFVALAGTAGDPVPTVPKTFSDFVKFVRETNNVAWRNFNVVSAPPNATDPNSGADGFHRFNVTVPGAFDEPREFTLKAVGTLPKGSSVRLRVPQALAQTMGIKGCNRREEKVVVAGLQPAGTVTVGKGVLAAESLARCELQVKVPADTYEAEGDHEFALVQEWEGVEVGRVTWRFGPAAKL